MLRVNHAHRRFRKSTEGMGYKRNGRKMSRAKTAMIAAVVAVALASLAAADVVHHINGKKLNKQPALQ